MQEWIIIALAVGVIFFFGKGKVLDWARSIGEARKEYNDAKTEVTK